MRTVLLALGSRGDVQPFVALGKGLRAAGHAVRVATHGDYESLVRAHGLDFAPVKGNVQEVVESEAMRELLAKGNFLAITAQTGKLAKEAALHWAEDGLAASRDADLIIAGIGGLFIGLALAEKLDLPFLQAYLLPFTPTRAFPGVLLPAGLSKLGGAANRLSHHFTRQAIWQGSRGSDNVVRAQVLGLPAAPFMGPYNHPRLRGQPALYGFSPSVIAKPPDWGEHIHVTGYWFLDSDENWTPPAALQAFLDAGPAPVYIGFGSMSSRKPEETADLALRALQQSRQRAVMLSGWGGLRGGDLPDSVIMVDSVPHAWLFPRMAAVVHHGGAGTTAAGFRAGAPSIIIPFFADQPFWGQRAAALGVGPEPIPRKQLTAERLAGAIQAAVGDAAMRQRAAALGAAIRAEDGVARAVEVVQGMADARR
ncbi:MAG: glycosyltransferase family 1 protein [Anaerolineae bacterium]|nr:glycosyltransferase family 1 protein [Anaerolineae bacterium]